MIVLLIISKYMLQQIHLVKHVRVYGKAMKEKRLSHILQMLLRIYVEMKILIEITLANAIRRII